MTKPINPELLNPKAAPASTDITILDWFAVHLMPALVEKYGSMSEAVAKDAYKGAEAMLKAREAHLKTR